MKAILKYTGLVVLLLGSVLLFAETNMHREDNLVLAICFFLVVLSLFAYVFGNRRT
ncbi:MAG: hypothetical protein H6585_00635 [Flavobacteriales bacterium]|nr:hypothetical protein [Flavobacteriales bacterium]MCB9446832.1 hypothetical protein [Flavobacteriales bacterium]